MGQLIQFTDRRITASRPVRSQTVADLLLALEEAPMTAMRGAVARRYGGRFVVVCCAAAPNGFDVFELSPDEARLAAHALFSEQAYVGSVEASVLLMDLARTADAMLARQGAV